MKALVLNAKIDCSQYFKNHGVNISYDYAEYPGIFPLSLVVSRKNEQGVMTDFYAPDVMKTLRNFVVPRTYDQVIFCYNPDDYDSKQNNTGGITFFNDLFLGTQLCTVRLDGYQQLYAQHETMHVLTHKMQRRGFQCADDMDMTIVNGVQTPYYHNEDPSFPDGNYNRTWKDLAPFMQHIDEMPPNLSFSTKKNSWVYDLQMQLLSLGYDCGFTDGYFGNKTLGAVRSLQQKNGLVVDGIVGIKTLTAMK